MSQQQTLETSTVGISTYALLRSLIRHPLRWAKWLSGAGRHRAANHRRWSNLANFDAAWDGRTKRIAARLGAAKSVVEFGAGRGTLRQFLNGGTYYLGSDIVARDAETLVWDLDHGAPILDRKFEAAVFSGVLEYVGDPIPVLKSLRNQVDRIVASYASIDEVPDQLTRLANGWANHLTQDQFIQLFGSCGFMIVENEPWDDSKIYEFVAL